MSTILESQEDSEEELISDEFSEALKDMTPKARKQVVEMMSIQMGGVMRQESAISKKITEEHISEYLEGSKLQLQEEYKERRESKIFMVIILTIILVFLVAVIILLKDNPEIMEKVLYTLAGLLAGALGGYGFGKSKRDD